jgi:hypothetical protein
MKSNSRPYLNAEIFLDYIRSVFLLYGIGLRSLTGLVAEDAVSLIDYYSADITDNEIHLLTTARVHIITFAPYITQILQVLDLTLFDVLNRPPGYALPFENDNATAESIMMGYSEFGQTMIMSNIRRAFQALGFEYDQRTEPYRLLFNEKKLRESAGFRMFWSHDFLLDGLSTRRRAAQFDWINRPESNDLTSVGFDFVRH